MFGSQQKPQADLEIFVMYDSKVGVYHKPTYARNRHDVLRQLDNFMADPEQEKDMLYTNAEDFSLFKIGTYSQTSGQITPCNHEHVANLHEIRSSAQRRVMERVGQQSAPVGILPT